jgi:hypothetical protein
VVVSDRTFFLTMVSGADKFMFQYNYEDRLNIYKMHQLTTVGSGSDVASPLQTDYCSSTGYMYLRGKTGDKSTLLVYRPDQLMRDSLMLEIDLGVKVADGTKIDFAASGGKYMYLYYNTGKA